VGWGFLRCAFVATRRVRPAMWGEVFRLYDRDQSGFADKGDVIAALLVTGQTEESAKRMLLSASPDGSVDFDKFKALIEEAVAQSLGNEFDDDLSHQHAELVKHITGILRDFEKRATARGEFLSAAESRVVAKRCRDMEEERLHNEMTDRQVQEKTGIQEAHVAEAVEFNRAWTKNMSEFEERAVEIVNELAMRHEAASGAYIEQLRQEAGRSVRPSKAVLELKQIQERLARGGNYGEAQRCQRKINKLSQHEAALCLAGAEEAMRRKVETLRSSQKLEMDALVARIDRGRCEHRGHWTQGAQRLMQSHKNMLTDLGTRQTLEVNRAATSLKIELSAVDKKYDRRPPSRMGSSMGSKPGTPALYALPPPRQRPSKLPMSPGLPPL